MIQIRIDKETDSSLDIMQGLLKALDKQGEKAELTFVPDIPEDAKNKMVAITFVAGLAFGAMMMYLFL